MADVISLNEFQCNVQREHARVVGALPDLGPELGSLVFDA